MPGFKRGRDYAISSYSGGAKRRRTMGSARKIVAVRTARPRANPRTGGYLGLELKFFDTAVNNSALATNTNAAGLEQDPTTVDGLSSIGQGDGENQRDGRKCVVKSVHVKGTISEVGLDSETANIHSNHYFVALVQDLQTNGAQLRSEDVFVNQVGAVAGGTLLHRNLQFNSRFKVLASRYITRPDRAMVPDSTTGQYMVEGSCVHFSMYKKLDMPITFTGTTAVIANSMNNSLHIIATATTATTLIPKITYSSRVRFMG